MRADAAKKAGRSPKGRRCSAAAPCLLPSPPPPPPPLQLIQQLAAAASGAATAIAKPPLPLDPNPDAAAVARFLRATPGLSRALVGDLLAAPDSGAVMDAYARSFAWRGVAFEPALRNFLSTFTLSGEAHALYRVLDAFASAYYDAATAGTDSSPFATADAVHVLAFSLILLNTDAHSPAVPRARKMTAAQFVANVRGVNGGGDLPESMLRALHASVVAAPLRRPDEGEAGAGGLSRAGSRSLAGGKAACGCFGARQCARGPSDGGGSR